MPITCTENVASRQYTEGQSAELLYTVKGTADQGDAVSAVKATAPLFFESLVRQPVAVEPLSIDETTPDECLWTGTVRYAPSEHQDPPETGDSAFSFDTSGGVQHITQSLSTVASYAPPGKVAPDFGGAIGVTHDNVEGVDIAVPVYAFSETHYLDDAVVTPSYKGTVFSLTGKVNNASFKGLAAGECLFLGACGSKRSADDWEITFRFGGSPNRTNLTVGSITGIDKKGWEYMWVRYADSEDAAAKTIVKKPVAVYVECVYDEGDFSALGIGT